MGGCASLSRLVYNRTLPLGLEGASWAFWFFTSAQLGLFPNALPQKTAPIAQEAPWKSSPTGETLWLEDCGRVETFVLGMADIGV